MKLCLSARMFTVAGTGDRFELAFKDFVKLAKKLGYDGVCTRRGQLDERTPEAEVGQIAAVLSKHDAPCSFVMGGAVSDEESCRALCTMVDHAARIGCRHVQPSVRDEACIPWAQRLCDYAAEKGVRISPQLHDGTLHDNVPNTLDLFERIDRENFGLNFEASHLILQDADVRGPDAVMALGEKIFTVCCQNYRKVDGRPVPVLPGDPEGVDFDSLFEALHGIGFDGYVTHMSGAYPDMDNETVCRAYVEKLRALM